MVFFATLSSTLSSSLSVPSSLFNFGAESSGGPTRSVLAGRTPSAQQDHYLTLASETCHPVIMAKATGGGRVRNAIQSFLYWLGPLYCVLLGALLLFGSFIIQLLTSIGVPYIKAFDL